MIAGLTPITAGEVSIDNTVVIDYLQARNYMVSKLRLSIHERLDNVALV